MSDDLILLQAFGFHSRFINWVIARAGRPKFAVDVNGIPTFWFHSACGPCRGCRLPHYLFILIFYISSIFLKAAVHHKFLHDYGAPRTHRAINFTSIFH